MGGASTNAEPASPPQRAPSWLAPVLVIIGALALRLGVLGSFEGSIYGEQLMPDEQVYAEWARRLHEERPPPRHIDDFAALPAHVFALAYGVLGAEDGSLRLLNVLLGSVACLCLYFVGAAIGGRRSGVLAGALGAIYGPFLLASVTAHKTALGLCLLGTAMVAATRALALQGRPRLIAVGLFGALLGLGVHVRPNLVVLVWLAPGVGWWLWRRAGVAPAPESKPRLLAAYAVGLAVALVPLSRGGVLGASEHGFNLYLGNDLNNALPYFRPARFAPAEPSLQARGFVLAASLELGRPLSRDEARAHYAAALRQQWSERPGDAVAKVIGKIGASLHHHEAANNHSLPFVARFVPALAVPWPGFGVLLGLALVGLWRGRDRAGVVALGLLSTSYWLTLVVFFTDARLRAALALLLIPIAAHGLSQVLNSRGRGLAIGVAVALAGLGVAHLPVQGAGDLTSAHNLHALFLFEAGDLDGAERLYRAASELEGIDADSALLGLAAVADKRGDLERARELLLRIPDDHYKASDKHAQLAALQIKQRQLPAAAEELERSLSINPGNLRLYPLLTAVYGTLGDRARAEAVRARHQHARRFFD